MDNPILQYFFLYGGAAHLQYCREQLQQGYRVRGLLTVQIVQMNVTIGHHPIRIRKFHFHRGWWYRQKEG